MTADPFATAVLRARVLDAWAASPARFREDANAEEDLARGSYRDRVVVELAQNAADAAARAGVPGRLLLRLTGDRLVAANTGAPLDPAAVESLSTLRASAKRNDAASAGRFGVGFAAVLSVSDEPAIGSDGAAVRWSRADARELAADLPALADELARRGDAVPVLRLPLPGTVAVPEGYDTAVELPLRAAAARDAVAAQLAAVDDALLLTLPALAEVTVEVDGAVRVLGARVEGADVLVTSSEAGVQRTARWRVVGRTGDLPAELLADRPHEERERPWWQVLAAVPVDADGEPVRLPSSVPPVLHAPTPSDEPVSLPALLVASVPLDPGRRRSLPGPLRDAVLEELAAAYADLVAELPPTPSVLGLLPPPLPSGELDAALAAAVLARLRQVPLLPAAADGTRLRGPDAVVVPEVQAAADPPTVGRELVAGLVDPGWVRAGELARLGARTLALADVVDALAGRHEPPAWWRTVYAALDGADRESLAAIPVPLVDGRLVRGPRGTVLPDPSVPTDWTVVAELGVRVVEPAAVHPLLLRLGAEPATPGAILRHPAVRGAVAAGAAPLDVVLPLVAAAGVTVADEPWLADLALPTTDGDLVPAGDCYLPGSTVLDWLDPADVAVVDLAVVDRVGSDVLRAVGVVAELQVVRATDVILDGAPDGLDLDDLDGWVDAVRALLPPADLPPLVPEVVAIRDLDLVRPERWPVVLAALAEPPHRAAVVEPTTVRLADGSAERVPSYARWWLATHARVGGRRLGDARLPTADPVVAALWDPLPAGGLDLDPAFAAALGVRTTLGALLATPDGADALLDRLADEGRALPARLLRLAYGALASLDPDDVTPPDRVRVQRGAGTGVVDAADALVADAPCWAQLPDLALVPGGADAAALADVLDLPLAADRVRAELPPGGVVPVPAAALLALLDAPRTYVEHDDLRVGGADVSWWVDGATVHACTLDGLARGLAWVAGRWSDRLLVAEVLRDPAAVEALLSEAAYDPGRPD